MSKRKKKTNPRREHRLRVRAVRRAHPDLRRLGRALIDLALAEAEAAAQADHAVNQAAADGSGGSSESAA
jgi:hypothetical protein